jgi:hypothetical protein
MREGEASAEAARLAEYEQVGEQFRALTDIRFKLLGFLPLGTVATVLASNDADGWARPLVAVFGLVVVACLATYDQRNDQLYDELVSRAAELERELGLERGSFNQRPMPWLRFGPWHVSHRPAVGLVYAASAGLWGFVLADGLVRRTDAFDDRRWLATVISWAAALLFVQIWRGLRRATEHARTALREDVRYLRPIFEDRASDVVATGAKVLQRLSLAALLEPDSENKVTRRLEHNSGLLEQGRRERDLSKLALALSRTIDLPARWIEDVWTGRR